MLFDINLLKENVEDVKKYKQREAEFERTGQFNNDVDDIDPNSFDPVTEEYEFIKKGFKNAIKHKVCLFLLNRYTKKINKTLTNLKIVGKENLKGVKASIVTCNHVSKCDSFAVRAAIGMDIMYVASDVNNWKNILGKVGRQTGYLPLKRSLDRNVMRKFNEAIEYYLMKKKKKILFYPEQAMWREEPRPRPIKEGAFHYAVKHKVPVVPLFITMQPKENMIDEQNRLEYSDYTIHILPPIYPKEDLSNKENVQYMKDENYRLWTETYEKVYNKKLEFNVEVK